MSVQEHTGALRQAVAARGSRRLKVATARMPLRGPTLSRKRSSGGWRSGQDRRPPTPPRKALPRPTRLHQHRPVQQILAVRLGDLAGASAQERRDACYLSLLHAFGCTSDAPEVTELYGDEPPSRPRYALDGRRGDRRRVRRGVCVHRPRVALAARARQRRRGARPESQISRCTWSIRRGWSQVP
jgi:hypothetical protein